MELFRKLFGSSGKYSGTGIARLCGPAVLLVWFLLYVLAESTAAAPPGPFWKVGRVVVQSQKSLGKERELIVKLSLRNSGRPGSVPVKILGRWKGRTENRGKLGKSRPRKSPRLGTTGKKGGKKLDLDELENLTQLGRFGKEIALKKTAILNISLKPLGSLPKGRQSLELLVITGKRVTDRKTVRLPANAGRR